MGSIINKATIEGLIRQATDQEQIRQATDQEQQALSKLPIVNESPMISGLALAPGILPSTLNEAVDKFGEKMVFGPGMLNIGRIADYYTDTGTLKPSGLAPSIQTPTQPLSPIKKEGIKSLPISNQSTISNLFNLLYPVVKQVVDPQKRQFTGSQFLKNYGKLVSDATGEQGLPRKTFDPSQFKKIKPASFANGGVATLFRKR